MTGRLPASCPRLASHSANGVYPLDRTSATAFVLSFVQCMINIWPRLFLPLYFRILRVSSTIFRSMLLPPSILSRIPDVALCGGAMTKTGRYRPVQHIDFALATIGFGLFTMLDEYSSTDWWTGFQIVLSAVAGSGTSSPLPHLIWIWTLH